MHLPANTYLHKDELVSPQEVRRSLTRSRPQYDPRWQQGGDACERGYTGAWNCVEEEESHTFSASKLNLNELNHYATD